MSYFEGRHVYGDDVYVDDYYLDEKWAYISGFPEYMVSNKGRVWSKKTSCFLKPKRLDRQGHLGVCLLKNGVHYYKYIHRLVAEAFIPNPHDLPVVRHLYDDRTQNAEDDLAWGTQRDNYFDALTNGTAYVLTDVDREKGNRDRCMPLVATNATTREKTNFRSQNEASRKLGIPQANIHKVVRGERRSAGGYYFKEVLR